MLADGGHVSIGGTTYKLMRRDDDTLALDEKFESLFAPTSAIADEIAKEQIRPEKLLRSWTDWSGGEGALIDYPQDPTTYDVGSLVNPTTRGKLTTRARRYRTAVARAGSNADTQMRPYGVSAYTHAVIGWEDNIIASTNAIGWAATQDTSPAGSASQWSDAITDGTNVAFLQGQAGTADIVPVVQVDAGVTTWLDAHSGTVPDAPMVGAVLDGLPYTFGLNTGVLVLHKKAAVMDTAADWGATSVFTTGIAPTGTWGHDYWTDCEAAENALFFSYATNSITYLWECRADVGRPFWTSPQGFAGKRLIYTSGVLFICGNVTTSSGVKYGEVWAIPLQTRSPVRIASPRFHKTTQLTDISVGCPGPGSTVFFADAASGKIFLYDIERDALHLFDDLVNGGTGDGMDFVDSTNLLDSLQSDFEILAGANGQERAWPTGTTGVNGWFAETNCAVAASSTVGGFTGAVSLRLSSTAGGNMSAVTHTGIAGIRVSPSTVYTAGFWLRTGTSARTARAVIRWYTSDGTAISDSDGTGAADSTTFAAYTASGTSPATAAYAALAVEVDAAGAGAELHYIDSAWFHAGASTVAGDRIAFLAMHGTKLFGATYTPFETGATSLQVFSYDDLLPQNRDSSQSIVATQETGETDFGLPMEIKGLIGFYVTYDVTDTGTTSGLIANSRIKVSYAIDGSSTYTDLTVITSSTTPTGAKGRVFQQVSSGSSTTKFSRLKVRVTLDNNATAGVAPPILFGVTAEAQPLAYARTWDMVIRSFDEEQNERPTSRQKDGYALYTELTSLATDKAVVTFLNGAWSKNPNVYTTHTVVVEDPQPILHEVGNGTFRVRLRDITAA